MNIKDIRGKSMQELAVQAAELRKELIKERAQVALGSQLKSPRKIHQLKKTVARIVTILGERERAARNASPQKRASAVAEGTHL